MNNMAEVKREKIKLVIRMNGYTMSSIARELDISKQLLRYNLTTCNNIEKLRILEKEIKNIIITKEG